MGLSQKEVVMKYLFIIVICLCTLGCAAPNAKAQSNISPFWSMRSTTHYATVNGQPVHYHEQGAYNSGVGTYRYESQYTSVNGSRTVRKGGAYAGVGISGVDHFSSSRASYIGPNGYIENVRTNTNSGAVVVGAQAGFRSGLNDRVPLPKHWQKRR